MPSRDARPIRLLLVDAHAIPRAGLRLLLESQPEFRVVGEAADRSTALTLATQAHPDVILLDLLPATQSGPQVLADLRAAVPHARLLVLTNEPSPHFHQQTIRLGARGVVHTEQSPETLFQAIAQVHAGEVWLDPALLAALLDELAPHKKRALQDPEDAKIATLSPREREVIALIGEGLRNKEIATRLFISETTVRHHLTSIFQKLEVADRLELVIYAYRHSLAPLPS
jgi:two-component system, NarL family, nitrate/nitrite response regulator NarL